MKLTSPAFEHEEGIPEQYTCDGKDVPPSLEWTSVPDDTVSLVLIMDDPDAPNGDWVHWVLYNISPKIKGLDEGKPLPSGVLSGANSWERPKYGGPCPPSGRHRYFFKLFALDIKLPLPEGTTKAQVLEAMEGHVLSQTELMGTYQRARS